MLKLLVDLSNKIIDHTYVYMYEYHTYEYVGILFNVMTCQVLCLKSSSPLNLSAQQQKEYLMALSRTEQIHQMALNGTLLRKSFVKYLDDNMRKFKQRKIIEVIDYIKCPLTFSELTHSEKVTLLRACGYQIDGNMVIAGKAVTHNYQSMIGYPTYDAPFHKYGSSREFAIWKNPTPLLDGKRVYEVYDEPANNGYSNSKYDDHCRGSWSSTQDYVLDLAKSGHLNGKGYSRCIEVMYEIDDPTLNLNMAGQLRALYVTVLRLRPSWRYTIDTVGKSFAIA